jgi:peptidoglycan/xylan/chitin deacetylase (PgdA/CDA1 family)
MTHCKLYSLILACALLAGCTAPETARRARVEPDPRWTYDHAGIVRGDTTKKQIALIFTGGDYGECAPHILDVLQAHGIKASFFVTGQFLSDPDRRSFIRRMVAEGHYVGPHSDAHLLYCPWEDRDRTLVTADAFRRDLEKNIADLRGLGALPGPPPLYFIPPYEWFNADQVRWAHDLGVVLFNFTPGSGSNRDWIPEDQPGFVLSTTILADILAYEQKDPHGLSGFLLLLHLGSLRQDKMHFQLEPLLAELSRRGYAFVRVDDLLRP